MENKENEIIIEEVEAEAEAEAEIEGETNKTGRRRSGDSFLKGALFGSILTAALVLAIAGGLRLYLSVSGRKQDAGVLTSLRTWEKLREVRDLIEADFLYDVDSELLETYLFKGLAAGLDDRYAAYYSVSEMEDINREHEGEYYGLGVIIHQDAEQNALVISSVYEESPAEKAGILPGDILVKIEDTDAGGMNLTEAIDLIKTYEATDLHLTLKRQEELFTVAVTFEQVQLCQVQGEMLEDSIGYMVIPGFDKATVSQFEETISDLKDEGMQALIVDVRDNPGGLLDSVTAILDDLLGEGLLIYTQTRNGENRSLYSDEERIFDGPVAVLVNANSASAAEVFAGVLQDYETGPVVGVTTYGKGIVQKTYTLPDGSAFKMTAEKYFTVKGQDVDGVGIIPDLIQEDADKQLDLARDALSSVIGKDSP